MKAQELRDLIAKSVPEGGWFLAREVPGSFARDPSALQTLLYRGTLEHRLLDREDSRRSNGAKYEYRLMK